DTLRQPLDAYAYLQGYIKLKDSMEALVGKEDVSGMLERIQHKYDLELLKRKDETKTIYLVIAIVFSIMAIVIIIQVWQRGVRTQPQNENMKRPLAPLEQSQRDH